MGIPATSADFTSLIVQSNLIDAATLDKYLKSHADTVTLDDPPQLAGALIRDGLLTQFQAEQLIQGKWKGFFIGRYKVLGVLGSGGMGKVFLCEHSGMRRQVAIKVLPPKMAEDPSTVEGFYREAQALASLAHRNIVHAFDAANDGGVHYLVMEYVKGKTLEDLVTKDGPLSAHRVIDYLRQAALGLQHAFEAGLVHRDIKPSNFLVTENGVVKILDLGLARFFQGPDSSPGSKPGEVMGTVDYMSPEQGLNATEVDIRGDIYSLGATFYFCLSGRLPFEGGTTAQKLLWHQIREPAPLKQLRPDLPTQLIDIISKMMAKEPANRFQTPDEVLAALPSQDVVESPPTPQTEIDTGLNLDSESPTTITVKRATRPTARWRSSATLLAGGSVLLVVAAVGVYFATRPGSPRQVDPPAANASGGGNQSRPGSVAPVAKKVWLCDLQEQDAAVGHGQFGKGGQLGYANQKIIVKGEFSPHGLSMHPPSNGAASVRYELGLRAKLFTGSVALNQTANGQTKTPLVFVVRGDGKIRWESKPIRMADDTQGFSVDLENMYRLELEVRCSGENSAAHAVWLEPAITLK
ncbi:MAG: hypothetical protein C0467_03510 [Planctomycetaceae bacterium]|nr:hypothetical protein [Planctomycetaceae bacterium]